MTSKEQLLATITEQQIQFIDLWFTDITGLVKSITVPSGEIETILDTGAHFDGSSIEGFARIAESDMVLIPDLNTFAILPWDPPGERTARLICTVHTVEGEPFIGDPRTVLSFVTSQAETMGFRYKTGMELEFFLFRSAGDGREPLLPQDHASYFDMSTDFSQSIRRKMLLTLSALQIRVDSTHHEIGSGQHEIDLHFDDALASADKVLTSRAALKAVAQNN
ncbi:MAG: glutamine synthetase beta-grasp domain-containing protein, partial [Anaerolineae bacterium]|nr:glutamine synthetase beta-grasp domain-containing protein [Anaerolineae bacterium]